MVKKKASGATKKIVNRRAKHDYALGDSLVAGLVLNGRETKALRLGQGHLRGAYVAVKDGELWLINSTIAGNNSLPIDETEQTRSRKLLASRREIKHLMEAKQQGQAIVPLEILIGGRYIKVRISVGRGKKLYDKRQILKKRDEARNINQVLKHS